MHERPRAGLQAGWMIAAVPVGVVAVGPDVEVEVELDGDRTERCELAETLATWDPNASSGAGSAVGPDLAKLAGRLAELGALGPAPAPVEVPLAAAVVAASKGTPPEGIVWTAEEALLLPRPPGPRENQGAVGVSSPGFAPTPGSPPTRCSSRAGGQFTAIFPARSCARWDCWKWTASTARSPSSNLRVGGAGR